MKKRKILLGTCLVAALIPLAHADRGPLLGAVPPVVQQECASCHIVYPPGMLPAGSWQRLVAGLDKHFGVDASLDSKTTKQVSDWLLTHAGTYRRVGAQDKPEQDRITKSDWFVRKHREVGSSVWSRPSIKSAANCTACHGQGASQGIFEEDAVRIPK